jgi:hypothetical protein
LSGSAWHLKQVDSFFSYDFVDVWGGTREESNEKVLAFFESSHFKVWDEQALNAVGSD